MGVFAKTFGCTVHERSAVTNSFSTYVWSKVDSCFARQCILKTTDWKPLELFPGTEIWRIVYERTRMNSNYFIALINQIFDSRPLTIKEYFSFKMLFWHLCSQNWSIFQTAISCSKFRATVYQCTCYVSLEIDLENEITVCQKGVKKKKKCQGLGHIFLV